MTSDRKFGMKTSEKVVNLAFNYQPGAATNVPTELHVSVYSVTYTLFQLTLGFDERVVIMPCPIWAKVSAFYQCFKFNRKFVGHNSVYVYKINEYLVQLHLDTYNLFLTFSRPFIFLQWKRNENQ